jgi:hypothetical protein
MDTNVMDILHIPKHVQTKVQKQKENRVAIVPGNGNAVLKLSGNVKTSKMHQFKPAVSLVYFLFELFLIIIRKKLYSGQ